MKVFVTGASGYLGAHIIPQLLAAGHTVTALSRSEASSQKLVPLGVSPILGTTTDLEVLRQAAIDADAVIHLAFNHALMQQPNGFVPACEEDRAAIKAMCDPLVGTGKTFIGSTGTLGITGDERCGVSSGEGTPFVIRELSEKLIHEYGENGVRAISLRLAPLVHGYGQKHVFITSLVEIAKKAGFVGYVGEGKSVWPAIHVKDAARLYILALTAEKIKPSSSIHGIAEGGVETKKLVEFIAKKLGMEAKSVEPAKAVEMWGFLGIILQNGGWIKTELTREWTGWEPTEITLFEDLETDYAF